MCRNDFYRKAPLDAHWKVTTTDQEAAYYLSVTATSRDLTFEPEKTVYGSVDLQQGVTFAVRQNCWYDIVLVCSNGAALATTIKLRGADHSPAGACSAAGGGLAGYWTITTRP